MSPTDQRTLNGQAPPAASPGPAGQDVTPAIQITDVTKTFGKGRGATVALDGVSLSSRPASSSA